MSDKIIGKRIKEVRYMTEEELNFEDWDGRCLVLVLEDNTLLYPGLDEEGNGPGVLFGRQGERSFGLA